MKGTFTYYEIVLKGKTLLSLLFNKNVTTGVFNWLIWYFLGKKFFSCKKTEYFDNEGNKNKAACMEPYMVKKVSFHILRSFSSFVGNPLSLQDVLQFWNKQILSKFVEKPKMFRDIKSLN